MTIARFLLHSSFIMASCSLIGACSATPRTTAEQQQLIVDRATVAVQDIFNGTTPQSNAQKLLPKAKAVMICPSIVHLSVVFGGSGGRCVLLSRDARGSWSDPAFYHLSSGSLGLQLGYQDAKIIFFVMSQHGIQALLDKQFKFDANASASFASLSSGTQSSTTGASNTDIYAVQKSNGIFAGVALGGSKLTVDSAGNRAYYKQSVGPEDIVVTMRVNNPAADPLRRILMTVGQQPAATPTSAAANRTAANTLTRKN